MGVEDKIRDLDQHSDIIYSETKAGHNTNRRVGLLGKKVAEILKQLWKDVGSFSDKFLRKDVEDKAAETITFEKGLKSSFVLIEDEATRTIAQGLTEAEPTEGESGAVVQNFTESVPIGVGGATTLGELLNVDESFDTVSDGVYAFKKKGEMFLPVLGGGGGGSASRLVLAYVSPATATVVHGRDYFIKFNFTSTAGGQDTGAGTVSYKVNNKVVGGGVVQQGETRFDVSRFLLLGDNTVSVTVTDSYGNTRTLNYGIEAVKVQLTSTFDATQIYSGDVLFRFTPIGFGTMKVHIEVDGAEKAVVTTTQSNRQLTHTIPALSHGAHIIRAYMTIDLPDGTITSNDVRYSIISAVAGNNTPIISSSFNQETATQFDTVNIPFMVYNPASLTANVELLVDGVKVSDLTVDRKMQQWSYNFAGSGAHTLRIKTGAVTKDFPISVAKSDISDLEETEGLELKLLSTGRSNAETTRDKWEYGAIKSVFSNFNWASDGWTTDSGGGVYLKVAGDARLEIPFKIFGADFKHSGKTIEFAFFTENVTDLDYVVLSCMQGGKGFEITPQRATFKSEQSSIVAQFKENEYVRIGIAVQQSAKQRLISLFVNGILSGVIQYPASDSFVQASPVNIKVSGQKATIGLYAVRVYATDLQSWQVLNNHIFDYPDSAKKAYLYGRNKILGADSRISYNSLVEQLPCLVITGDLPAYKGDKKTCAVSFEDRKNPERSFTAANVQNDVQGTSSQYYPRKNYKMKFRSGFEMSLTGEHAEGFQTHPHTLPATVFTHKADFAEASGTHNTGMAKVMENLLKKLNILTPPQKANKDIRTTVDGFAIAIFHRTDENAPMTFVGKYNFNTDKAAENTFGFAAPAECWEVLNNTSGRVLFQTSDYSTSEWLNDFEGRFPDGNEDYTNLKRMTDWVVSCKGNPTKFKAELNHYFDLDFLLSYYILTELFAMVDQRAKNCFWTTFDKKIWLPIFYDNDTCLGINNEGVNAFSFDVETGDKLGTQSVWNADNSELWKLVEQAYPNELKAMYQRIRKDDTLSYDNVLAILNGEHSDLWCETVYNEDGQFKYIDPLLEDGIGAYLYAAQGSRAEHRKWWLYNRFKYMDSRYDTGAFKDDFITMRLYTPSGDLAVAPNADFTVEPFDSQYIKAKWGSYITHKRVKKGETVTFKAPAITFNDTETIIYGASYLRSIGDLSGKYAGTIDVSGATKLTELLIGSGVAGYKNTNLLTLHVGNNKMLRKIDIRNCLNLTQPLDLSGCDNIEEIYAQGTGITGVELRDGGIVKRLHLPATIRNLNIVGQKSLPQNNLSFEGLQNLVSLRVENSAIDGYVIAKNAKNLQILRLVGIASNDSDLTSMLNFLNKGGLDENGFVLPKAVVTGNIHVDIAHEKPLSLINSGFPELTVSYDNFTPIPKRKFIIYNEPDSAVLSGVSVFINNVEYVSNSQGVVELISPDLLNVKIESQGFKIINNVYPASNEETVYNIVLTPIVNWTIITCDVNDVFVPDVPVFVDGVRYTTNHLGILVLSVSKGSYVLEVENLTFNIEVGYNNVTTTARLQVRLDELKPLEDGSVLITILPDAGKSYTFTAIKAANLNIDWGDGSTSVMVDNTITHSFSERKYYLVRIYNVLTLRELYWDRSIMIAFWSTGNSYLRNMSFHRNTNLAYITKDVFKLDAERKSFFRVFEGCKKLQSIPSGLFDAAVKATSFGYVFSECESIRSIPEGLFDNNVLAEDFQYGFQGCISLKSIPEGLFDNNINVLNFSSVFRGCSNLLTAPQSLFDKNVNATNFESACSYWSSFSGTINFPVNVPGSTRFSSMFYSSRFIRFVINTETPPTITISTFNPAGVVGVYVPDEAVDLYKTATNWNILADKILPLSQYTE